MSEFSNRVVAIALPQVSGLRRLPLITAGICEWRKGGSGVSSHSSNPETLMSALGQKRTSRATRSDVRFTPNSGHR